MANSIALLAEAAHMLADSASLLLAILAIRVAQRPATGRRTYGHGRYQPLAAFINGQLLLLLTAWVVYEAVGRLMHLPAVNGRLMLGIALLGGSRNLCDIPDSRGSQRSLNERGARVHVLSDLLGSAAASVAAALILFAGWTIADPLLSLLVAVLIFRSAWALTRESADVLLESAPARFDVTQVQVGNPWQRAGPTGSAPRTRMDHDRGATDGNSARKSCDRHAARRGPRHDHTSQTSAAGRTLHRTDRREQPPRPPDFASRPQRWARPGSGLPGAQAHDMHLANFVHPDGQFEAQLQALAENIMSPTPGTPTRSASARRCSATG